ncbi:polyprenyl synthetase family protein [Canibacter sp. lx-72]|uniref:polyprenyl synthetase family protein n=1 Tax=Canibacter zhuwentaonis TaxID=2837491 RepID=UPI001BDC128C|nr:polyprenyl synthetase family protein [Canibacter zhuwentaonis]MBT1018630.1 polyprenyl synthetase family protein [Canibacter zhuwentaonis]MBT1035860.1 polyprenyl synthetase family protein [Canibacter zhuwentaonis]
MSEKINITTATSALPAKLLQSVAHQRHIKALERELALVEAGLLSQIRFASPIADAAAKYLAAAGGKRIRPLLLLLVSELGSGPTEQVRRVAQVIEITHLASLYHDDVMDEAVTRRGVQTAHLAWSNSVAILAGDLLFARASRLVADMSAEAILLQSETFERLCLGQLHETVGPGTEDDELSFYLQVLADKTGSLISCAARMGALVSGAPREFLDPLTAYGEGIGVAFQLVDDVIDLSPAAADTGKRAGTDLRAGVTTLPLLLLRKSAATNAADADLLRRIETGVAAVAAGADPSVMDKEVTELYRHEVTAQTAMRAHKVAGDAVQALASLPAGRVKTALEKLAKTIVERVG